MGRSFLSENFVGDWRTAIYGRGLAVSWRDRTEVAGPATRGPAKRAEKSDSKGS
jgi:hypothetical protein